MHGTLPLPSVLRVHGLVWPGRFSGVLGPLASAWCHTWVKCKIAFSPFWRHFSLNQNWPYLVYNTGMVKQNPGSKTKTKKQCCCLKRYEQCSEGYMQPLWPSEDVLRPLESLRKVLLLFFSRKKWKYLSKAIQGSERLRGASSAQRTPLDMTRGYAQRIQVSPDCDSGAPGHCAPWHSASQAQTITSRLWYNAT